MSEKKLYEKPVLEYCGRMIEHTKAVPPTTGSNPMYTFKQG
jgi:hypothetical protein